MVFVDLIEDLDSSQSLSVREIGGKAKGTVESEREISDLRARLEDNLDLDNAPLVSVPPSYLLPPKYYERFKRHNGIEINLTGEMEEGGSYDVTREFWESSLPNTVSSGLYELLSSIEGPIAIRSNQTLEDWGLVDAERLVSMSGSFLTAFYHNDPDVDLDERVKDVSRLISMVYASNLSSKANKRRKVEKIDEEGMMGVLIQPLVMQELVPGYHGPVVSGVLHSHNPIPFHDDLEPEHGMATLVLGNGTWSVEQRGVLQMAPGNPRVHSLLAPSKTVFERAQTGLDVVDFEYSPSLEDFLESSHKVNPGIKSVGLKDILDMPFTKWRWLMGSMQVYDGDRLRGAGYYPDGSPLVTFHEWIDDIASILHPVMEWSRDKFNLLGGEDIEFAMLNKDGRWHLYITQLRPLAARTGKYIPKSPPVDKIKRPDRVLLRTKKYSIDCQSDLLEKIIFVNEKYFNLGEQGKKAVAQEIGRLNNRFEKVPYALISPGRLGSEDMHEGVPVDESQISNSTVLVGYATDAYRPDFNLGAHFSKFIMERGIIPVALLDTNTDSPDQDNFLNYDFLSDSPDSREGSSDDSLSRVLSVIDLNRDGGRGGAIRGNRKKGGTMLYLKNPNKD